MDSPATQMSSLFSILTSQVDISQHTSVVYVLFCFMKESKKLAKYNAALKKTNQVNFDGDMSFLDGFVQKAKMNGAKEYRKIRAK